MDDWKLRTKAVVRLERSAKHFRTDWKIRYIWLL